ncbi:MAG TPA: hypothetical protein VKO18_17485 [Terriglobia bacterium]|nr:hypothetical protein [Terriglobia bacterium]
MDPEAHERFEKVELKLSEHDERIIAHDSSLTAIRNLLQVGMRMLVDMETKMAAVIDSETRLYGVVQELAESQKSLAEAQKRTEESLRRFLDRSGNGHPS